MITFKYYKVEVPMSEPLSVESLDMYGEKGWELTSVVPMPRANMESYNVGYLVYYFKKKCYE